MDELNNMMNLTDELYNNSATRPLMDLVDTIMKVPDDELNDDIISAINKVFDKLITEIYTEQAIQQIVDSFEGQGLTRAQLKITIDMTKKECSSLIESLKPSEHKRKLLDMAFKPLFDALEATLERYHSYDIVLPIWLDEGAQVPTYAHDTDACADLYALETVTIGAHTLSNKIHTGVHIALPENWEVGILPRSSIGSKTGLRLSNSRGVIDEQYRDELMILYDNISDSDYTINAGDRIAQMYVRPTYRFKAQTMTKEEFDAIEGNRGGGLGSTGR